MPPPTKVTLPRFRPSAEPPLPVELAFWFAVAQPAISLITSPPSTNVIFFLIGFLIGFLVGNAVGLWIAWRTRGGANWARVLRTIFAALTLWYLVTSILGITTPYPTVGEAIISAFQVALDIVCVVLLWRPASNVYFSEVAVEKRLFRQSMLG